MLLFLAPLETREGSPTVTLVQNVLMGGFSAGTNVDAEGKLNIGSLVVVKENLRSLKGQGS